MLGYILMVLYVLSCFVLIVFVLLQPGKSDAAAVFGGGGANSTAFGPRGTQTVLAKITITAAILFFLIAFLFSIPGLFAQGSLGEGVGPAEPVPATVPAPEEEGTPPASSAVPPAEEPTPSDKPAGQGSSDTGQTKDAKKDEPPKKP